jgi:K+-transporting ATPase KdpF subunit
MRPAETRPLMIENIILLVISALLLVYLVYALLRPEKF